MSLLLRARVAAILYFVALAAALSEELLLHGKPAAAVGLVALFCNTTVSALIFLIFRVVQRHVALLALILNLAGLACEAVHWQPHGIDLGLAFHGGYCVLIGFLIFESALLPQVFGVLMMFAGCAWLTYLSPPFANRISPYNLSLALLGEASLMIWLMAKGVILERWRAAS